MSREAELDRLRRAWERAAEEAVPGDSCPSPDRLWECAHGELDPPAAREILSHAATCAVCAEAWDLAAADRQAAAESETEAEAAGRRRWRVLAAAAGLAAAVLLVVGIHQMTTDGPPSSTRRAGAEPEIVSLLAADRPLPRSQPVLRWQYPGDSSSFAVRTSWLSPHGLVALDEVEGLSRPQHRLPAGRVRDLPPDARLYWEVTVELAGSTVARRTFSVRLE